MPIALPCRPPARARVLHSGRSGTARQRMRIGISPRAAVNEAGCCNRTPRELKRTAPLECFFILPRQLTGRSEESAATGSSRGRWGQIVNMVSAREKTAGRLPSSDSPQLHSNPRVFITSFGSPTVSVCSKFRTPIVA